MKQLALQQLTPAQAEAQFPGCTADDDVKEMLAVGAISSLEPDYFRLFLHEGRLLGTNYEVGWLGWSEWVNGEWRSLEDADYLLLVRLREDGFQCLPAVS